MPGASEDVQDYIDRFKPERIPLMSSNGVPEAVVDVAIGFEHTVVATAAGRVYSWGSNRFGQLGIQDKFLKRTSVPQLVEVTSDSVVNVSAGTAHTLALTSQGIMFGWGANKEGQLGLGGCRLPGGPGYDACLQSKFAPAQLMLDSEGEGLPPMKLIAAGGHVASKNTSAIEGGHSVAVSKEDQVFTWGDNFYGQLGVGQTYKSQAPFTNSYTPNEYDDAENDYYNRKERPVPLPEFGVGKRVVKDGKVKYQKSPVIEVAAGSFHVALLFESGEIWTWGDNYHGQLGHQVLDRYRASDTPQQFDVPRRVTFFDKIIETTAKVQQPDGSMKEEPAFETLVGEVEEEGRFVHVAAGKFQTMAVTETGKVFVWGTNSHGEQGTCGCKECRGNGICGAGPPRPEAEEEGEVDGGANSGPDAPRDDDAPSDTMTEAGEDLSMEPNGMFCDCTCPGLNTCAGQGFCVGYDNDTSCVCTDAFAEETSGVIYDNPTPMILSLHSQKNISFAQISAGGGLFGITSADCPHDDFGTLCSGRGECMPSGECKCQPEYRGRYCEKTCPLGTAEDGEEMAGLVCAGHGRCSLDRAGATQCSCDEYWFGTRCSFQCPNVNGVYCSGRGTCKYEPEINEEPYCVCERYFTKSPDDPVLNQQNKEACVNRELVIQKNGWCSYYSKEIGFENCYHLGLCGSCEDSAPPLSGLGASLLLACISAVAAMAF